MNNRYRQILNSIFNTFVAQYQEILPRKLICIYVSLNLQIPFKSKAQIPFYKIYYCALLFGQA